MQRELPARPGEKFTAHLLVPRAPWGGREGRLGPAGSRRPAGTLTPHPGRLLRLWSSPECSAAGDRPQPGQGWAWTRAGG